MAQRDPITCHILDTTTGRPAANVAVKLICARASTIVFTSTTNQDGRIANWAHASEKVAALIAAHAEQEGTDVCPKGSTIWKLVFDTGRYYGLGQTFFPAVELTFLAKEGEHFHVPLLLGPYSYTTYRGS